MRAYLLCVPLCVLLGLTHRGAPLSKQPLSLGGIDMSELEVEMSAGCDPNDDGCEVVEPLVSIEMRALDTNATVHIPPRPIGGTEAANVHGARDAFFVWLTHPPDSFWVNLAPTESDRVIDSELGRTEVGKTMLDADLLLKRTAAKLLHPDHEVGAKFWNELYGWVGTRGARLMPLVPAVDRTGRRQDAGHRGVGGIAQGDARAARAAAGHAGSSVRQRRRLWVSRRRRR